MEPIYQGVQRPGRQGSPMCERCRRHKRRTRAPCIIDPNHMKESCISCKKTGQCGSKMVCRGKVLGKFLQNGSLSTQNSTNTPIETRDIVLRLSAGNPQIYVTQLFEDVSKILWSFQRLLSTNPVPAICADQSSYIFQQISSRVSSAIAHQVTDEFENHLLSTDAQLIGFRASVVYPFESDEQSWPFLEWKETDGTNGVAIFDIDEESPGCSYLIQRVFSPVKLAGGKGSKLPSLAWNVRDMCALKTLFQAAQHALGILSMPNGDALKLYCHQNIVVESPSSEDATRLGQILFDHFLQMERLNSAFDRVAHLLEDFCCKEVVEGGRDGGDSICRYFGSLNFSSVSGW